MNKEERRFSQLTSAGCDPYNKSEPGRSHVWLYDGNEAQRRRERWLRTEVDMSAYCRAVGEMAAAMNAALLSTLARTASQLFEAGYDPYNNPRQRFTFQTSTSWGTLRGDDSPTQPRNP